MTCADCRDLLTAAPGELSPEVRAHTARCEACRLFAARLRAARETLRGHHAGVAPDPGFATRVRARLANEPSELLGLAALRLLPASLVLLAVLAWFAWDRAPYFEEQPAVDADPIALLFDDGELP